MLLENPILFCALTFLYNPLFSSLKAVWFLSLAFWNSIVTGPGVSLFRSLCSPTWSGSKHPSGQGTFTDCCFWNPLLAAFLDWASNIPIFFSPTFYSVVLISYWLRKSLDPTFQIFYLTFNFCYYMFDFSELFLILLIFLFYNPLFLFYGCIISSYFSEDLNCTFIKVFFCSWIWLY